MTALRTPAEKYVMRMQKKILAGLLSGLLLIGSCLPAAASREADPQIETLYQDALSAMKEKGVPDSFPDGPFLTEAVLTREQGAVITASLILGKEAETPFGDSAPFADVSADRWSAPYIAWCRDRGILLGYGDGCFHPEDPLTGDQFAKMLLCALGTARDGKYADSGDAWAEAVRTDAALQWLMTHPEGIAVVSGGQGPGEDMTEARAMADWLIARGVDPARILLEEEATSSYENLLFSLRVYEANGGDPTGRIALCSSEYHMHRLRYMGERLGFQPVMVAGRTGHVTLRLNYLIREAAALWKCWLFGLE